MYFLLFLVKTYCQDKEHIEMQIIIVHLNGFLFSMLLILFLITLVFILNSFCFSESSIAFEKAYCEYRLNRTQEALSTLRKIPQPDTRAKELLAQVVCRIFI